MSIHVTNTSLGEVLNRLSNRCALDAMFRGDKINLTERRAVLHTALRAPRDAVIEVDGQNVVLEVHAVLDRMAAFSDRVRSGDWKGYTGKRITTVINIGIGGSDLGPVMATEALRPYWKDGMNVHFVSNVDGHDIASVLAQLEPAETFFIVASKTFTTQETMANAETAKAWFMARGGENIEQHFVAATTNVEAAARFGIATTFAFWDWVGGRYSLWSAIGLPIAIAIGAEGFRALLAGAHAMDEHFANSPVERNVPMLLGLVDLWYRNFHEFTSRSVAPYAQGLKRLPAFLQQLEMESNGKSVTAEGLAVERRTAPVTWGGVGTDAQHAVFQLLHQGTAVVPVEFLCVIEHEDGQDETHHRQLLLNAFAQGAALMAGRASDDCARAYPGNRPSMTILLDRLDPRTLGALLAFYEHRTFANAVLLGINPFDQFGVELGKEMARAIDDPAEREKFDPSTRALIERAGL